MALGILKRSGARLAGLFGPDLGGTAAAFGALALSAIASVVAGLTLAGAEQQLTDRPGLMVMVPAAIGIKGAIFGGLGSRLSTAIHTGAPLRPIGLSTVVGQNLIAAAALSLIMSVVIAFAAVVVSGVFGVEDLVPLDQLVVVSAVSGVMASVVIGVITLLLAEGSARRGWDLDNVTAPLVTATGDLVTLPLLVLVARRLGPAGVNRSVATAMTLAAVVAMIWGLRTQRRLIRRILAESLPVLFLATGVSVIAGLVLDRRLEGLADADVLLVLLPGFLGSAGALGGILSSRLSSKLHLGLVRPRRLPGPEARADLAAVMAMAAPVFAFTALVAEMAGTATGAVGPGLWTLTATSVLAGTFATVLVTAIAYYGTIGAHRLDLDPDTHGIPLVTSSLDVVGAAALTAAAGLLGVI